MKIGSGSDSNARLMRNSRWSRVILAAISMLAITGSAGVVRAAISGSTFDGGQALADGGTILLLSDPIGTIAANGFDDDNVRIFDEAQDVMLTANLSLDQVDPALTTTVLGPGSVVSSHYLYFDPATTKDAIGTITFDEPILGVIRINQQFTDSNGVLGNPTATYSASNPQLESGDITMFSGNTLSFDISARTPGDGLRIVTGIDPVPGINVCDAASMTLSGTVTGGQAFSQGGQFRQICDPIGDVGEDNFQSPDVFAFEEQQAVLLQADLVLDDLNFVPAGETVSSFYVVFDPGSLISVQSTITFPDTIIGVIRDKQRLNDSLFLGNASANYLSPNLLGLEASDSISISGNQLTFDVSANSPGDSVRVILGSASPSLNINPCAPADVTLSGSVTGGSAASGGGVFTQLCDPIGSVGNDNFQSNDLFAFEEMQDLTLSTALATDEGPMATIPVGTRVSSYYVAFDPSSSGTLTGTIQFPRPILGVMTSTATLNPSDALGNPTATYLNPNLRGLEAGTDTVGVVGNTLSVNLSASSPGDYLRVITEGAPPPVPGMGVKGQALLLLLFMILGTTALAREARESRNRGRF